MSEPFNPTEFVSLPQGVHMLGHAVALRALRDASLMVYGYNGRRLVRRDAVERLRPHGRPVIRRRGDMLPSAANLGERR